MDAAQREQRGRGTSGVTTLVVRDGIGTITIDNTAARNALDNPTRQSLLAALRDAAADPACVAMLLTGAADTFCAGGDLSSMPTEEPAIRARLGEMHDIVRLIHAGPKPVVAAVDGFAFGAGLSLTAASDHVVATLRARFGCIFSKVGLVADTGLLKRLLAASVGSLDEMLAAEMEAQIALLAGDDFAEGRAAFFEKRPPVFGQGSSPNADSIEN